MENQVDRYIKLLKRSHRSERPVLLETWESRVRRQLAARGVAFDQAAFDGALASLQAARHYVQAVQPTDNGSTKSLRGRSRPVSLAGLSEVHQRALEWFSQHAGEEHGWPQPIEGIFLANKAKGIHKPKGLSYALSVRQSLNGPYADEIKWTGDGHWQLSYRQEGNNSTTFTNEAMRACMTDVVPVGVLIQVKPKPKPRYLVLGWGRVVGAKEGVFTIEQCEGGAALSALPTLASKAEDFDVQSLQDARRKMLRSIAMRQGQPAFRANVLEAYGWKCAMTGCDVRTVLEAAHIVPYNGRQTNHVQNGIALRGDVHTLFDLGLISVDPASLKVRLDGSLQGSAYASLHDTRLNLPASKQHHPSRKALEFRQSQAATRSGP